MLTLLAVTMALGLLMTPPVQATSIPITNPSAATGDMTGWTSTGADAQDVIDSDGDGWSFWIWDSTMSQSLANTFEIGNEYTLTVDVIDRPGSDSYWDFGLYYDDAGTLVPVVTTAGGPQNNGSFLEVSTTAMTVAAADAWVGENIVVVLSTANAPSGAPVSWVDNVRLDVVPEPATMALLGLGGLMLRRRRNS